MISKKLTYDHSKKWFRWLIVGDSCRMLMTVSSAGGLMTATNMWRVNLTFCHHQPSPTWFQTRTVFASLVKPLIFNILIRFVKLWSLRSILLLILLLFSLPFSIFSISFFRVLNCDIWLISIINYIKSVFWWSDIFKKY